MPQVKFGPNYTRIHNLVGVREFAEVVKRLDFDSIWTPETPVTPEPGLDCLATLGAFSQAIDRVTLGTCAILAPLRSPAMLAKQIATLDFLSNGRVVLGIATGGRTRMFEASGVDPRERGARTDEILEAVIKLWTDRPASHRGRFYSFEDIVMEPLPVQRPHPPIWVGGEVDAALRRTARWGDGYLPASISPSRYEAAATKIRRYAEEYGRSASDITLGLHIYFRLDSSPEAALDKGNDALVRRLGSRLLKLDSSCAVGTARDCIETLKRFVSVGVEHFVISPAAGREETVPQLERFAKEVMPFFR